MRQNSDYMKQKKLKIILSMRLMKEDHTVKN